MRRTILIVIITVFWTTLAAANGSVVSFHFPKMGGEQAWLYYFAGNSVDSLSVSLDADGKASVEFPQTDYRGMVYLSIQGAGGGEFVLAEPALQINCEEDFFKSSTLQFSHSEENTFLHQTFFRLSYLYDYDRWLKSGEQFAENKKNKSFAKSLTAMLKENEYMQKAFKDSVAASSLYAARYVEQAIFLNKLYKDVQSADNADVNWQLMQDELENKADINALYTSGSLWIELHNYYPVLFERAESDDTQAQEKYAASVAKILNRLQEPVRSDFLASALSVCERTDRQIAEEKLIGDFIAQYAVSDVQNPSLKRILSAYSINRGNQAPMLKGLANPVDQPAILLFFDSSCDHCLSELDWLNKHYAEIASKGYRVISISADTSKDTYENVASALPWENDDKLCDYKGFDGENFKNYGIIATPTIFVTDVSGVIIGKYARMTDIF